MLKVWSSFMKIPLPDGQSALRLHAERNLSPSLLNNKRNVRIYIYIIIKISKKREPLRYQKLFTGYLLEKNVIGNKFVLKFCVHAFKLVELSFKVAFELFAGCDDVVHDFKSLLL